MDSRQSKKHFATKCGDCKTFGYSAIKTEGSSSPEVFGSKKAINSIPCRKPKNITFITLCILQILLELFLIYNTHSHQFLTLSKNCIWLYLIIHLASKYTFPFHIYFLYRSTGFVPINVKQYKNKLKLFVWIS